MRIPPLEVILTWPTPNYDNPHTRGEALLVLMVIFSFLVLLAVLGRFYSRLIVKNWFGWDDSMITLALVSQVHTPSKHSYQSRSLTTSKQIFTLGMNVTVILANRLYGWNRHLWDVKPNWYQNAMIVAFTAKLLFVFAATFTRMSLVFFYYRLVRDSGIGWFRYVLHASMAFIVALGIGFTCVGIWLCVYVDPVRWVGDDMLIVSSCRPVQAYWVFPPIANAKCLDEGIVTLIIGILNCVADLLTTLLPIPLVMRLKMPLKQASIQSSLPPLWKHLSNEQQRIGVCVLLSLGVVVTVAGVVRTYYIWQSLINSWDETWYSYPLWICAAIEIDVAVVSPPPTPFPKPLTHLSGFADLRLRPGPETPPPQTHLPPHLHAFQQTHLPALLPRPHNPHRPREQQLFQRDLPVPPSFSQEIWRFPLGWGGGVWNSETCGGEEYHECGGDVWEWDWWG